MGTAEGMKRTAEDRIGERDGLAFEPAHGFPSLRLLGPGYFADAVFLCFSQRRLTASAMRFLPSGVRFLFFLAGLLVDLLAGRAVFLGAGATPSPSRVRACCKWAISRSICARISETATIPPVRSLVSDSPSPSCLSKKSAYGVMTSAGDTISNCILFYK